MITIIITIVNIIIIISFTLALDVREAEHLQITIMITIIITIVNIIIIISFTLALDVREAEHLQ